MRTKSAIAAAGLSAAVLAGCGDGVESTADPGTTEQPRGDGAVEGDASDPVMVGEGFRTEGFEAKVTDVELGVTSISRQGSPLRPKYGQFVVVTVEAENVGKEPDMFATDMSELLDEQGRTYESFWPNLDQPLGDVSEDQPPGTSAKGAMLFDVPPSVTGVDQLIVQSDPEIASGTPTTTVQVK